jgi:hypothetical protein
LSLVLRAVVARLLAEDQHGGHADLAADDGAGLSADDRVEAHRKIALGLVRIAAIEPGGGDEAEHAIAKEFQPLIIGVAMAAMRERAAEQCWVARRMIQALRDPGGEGVRHRIGGGGGAMASQGGGAFEADVTH